MQVISTISRITVHLLVLSIATADSSVNPQTPSDRLESTTATSGANGTTTGTPRKAGHALVNFVIIFADDVGYGDMGLTCGMRESAPWLCPRTPVLDNLARSNHTVFFERFYTAASACSPARAALLTGRNNRRSCIDHVLPCSHDSWACSSGLGISDKEFSIAHAVKLVKDRNSNASMYMTQLLGKWHLGDLFNKVDASRSFGFTNPGHLGFDEWDVTPSHTPTATPNCACFPPRNWSAPDPPIEYPSAPIDTRVYPLGSPGEDCIVGGGIVVDEAYECSNFWRSNDSDERGCTNLTKKIVGSSTDHIVEQFKNFVERAVDADRPFLSTLFLHGAHLPRPALPHFYTAAIDSRDPDYIGTLEYMDASVGDVLDILAANGVANHTLVWVSSDNGPACDGSPFFCSRPIGQGRSNGGLRDAKVATLPLCAFLSSN
eukprot:INCI17519.3.p1 GENE.INCI17519.3~~INCI17519.3.p1  ORF type:complete len:485 (+),score=46.28 INCI17519.3:157-1455(+)